MHDVCAWGADPSGTIDSTSALQGAINSGPTFVPSGSYKVLGTITLPPRCVLAGEGRGHSVINSNIVGAPLFKTHPAGAAFVQVSNLRLNGNNVSGAGGSGHCFNFIDPTPGAGGMSPQVSELECLWIDGFLGTDDADQSGSKKVSSAGVIQYGSLGVTCRRVYVSDCGHGFYLQDTQNCRVEDCLATIIQKAALFAYNNENLIIDKCDLINAGQSGSHDAGYPTDTADFAGVFVASGNRNLVLRNSKLKGFKGKALIVVKGGGAIANDQNVVIENNWLRGDAQAEAPHKAIYAEQVAGLSIRGNLFHPANSGYSQPYETIELYNPSNAPAFESTVESNTFMDVAGMTIAYNIRVAGNSQTRTHRTTIRNNRFGSNATISADCVVAADILLENARIEASVIGNNSHYAPTKVTRTAGVKANNVTFDRTTIAPSLFQTGGGAITENYSGVSES